MLDFWTRQLVVPTIIILYDPRLEYWIEIAYVYWLVEDSDGKLNPTSRNMTN